MASLEKLDQFLKELNKVELIYSIEKGIVASYYPENIYGDLITFRYNDCYLLKEKEHFNPYKVKSNLNKYIKESKDKFENLKIDIQTDIFDLEPSNLSRIFNTYLDITKDVESNIISEENYVKNYYNKVIKYKIPDSDILNSQEDCEDSINKLYVFHLDLITQLIDFLEYQIREIEENPSFYNSGDSSFEKIKWMGNTNQLTFVLIELARKGFIELPSTRGQASLTKFANICLSHFEIKGKPGNFIRDMVAESTLEEANRAKFTIPNSKDIS